MAVGHFGHKELAGDGGDGTLYQSAGRVDVIYDIQGRGFVAQQLEVFHELHHVLGVVEVAHPHVLDFHHHGVQLLQAVGLKGDVVGARREFGIPRRENHFQVSPLAEDIIHPPATPRVPAVLGAEAAHLAIQQGFVQLVLQGRSPE